MTYQDLVKDIKFLITGSSTGTIDFSDADICACINRRNEAVGSLIMSVDNRWEFDDNNYTTLPIGNSPLIAEQADYGINAGSFLDILRVEMKDASGNGVFLEPVSYADKKGVAMTEWLKTSGTPQYYDKVGNSIILYPTPNYAMAAGLRVYFKRPLSSFVVTDTIKEPGFNPQYHRLLSYGGSVDCAIANGLTNKMTILNNEIAKMEMACANFYSSRGKDDAPKMSVYKENIIII